VCLCCAHLGSFVHLCAINSEADQAPWLPSHALIEAISADFVVPAALEKNNFICTWCGYAKAKKTAYWIQTDRSDAGVRHLLGPGCLECFQKTYLRLEEQSGRAVQPLVFAVDYSARLAKKITAAQVASPSKVDEEAWKEADGDGPGDYNLF
jgi:hypothetical protein